MKSIIGFFMLIMLIINGMAFYVFNKKIDQAIKELKAGQIQIAGFLMAPDKITGPLSIYFDTGIEAPEFTNKTRNTKLKTKGK